MGDAQLNSEKTIATRFVPGELVEVRSEAEILATLDERGTLGNLPFMPEMLKFCGKQFRVSRVAFKTCVDDSEMRQIDDTIFLEEVRCDGANHNNCAKACLIFWKDAWLRRIGTNGYHAAMTTAKVTASDLVDLAQPNGAFFCQSSEIVNCSKPLPWWEATQYVRDITYNKSPLSQCVGSFAIAIYNKFAHVLGLNAWKAISGNSEKTFSESLNLQPGELVRVKPIEQIKQTLDGEGKHKSLLFAPHMAAFCGDTLKVRGRVEQIVLEGTTRQRKLKDTVLLEGATCDGVCHRMCPRQSFLFWRECWLERVPAPSVAHAS